MIHTSINVILIQMRNWNLFFQMMQLSSFPVGGHVPSSLSSVTPRKKSAEPGGRLVHLAVAPRSKITYRSCLPRLSKTETMETVEECCAKISVPCDITDIGLCERRQANVSKAIARKKEKKKKSTTLTTVECPQQALLDLIALWMSSDSFNTS